MLSANQAQILDALHPTDQVFLHQIAEWQISGNYAYGEDAARNALKRMEDRGLVLGEGIGRERGFVITDAGARALREHKGEPEPEPLPESASRDYVVLEELNVEGLDVVDLATLLADVDVIYVHKTTVDARNTEHALRLAAADYGDVDAEPKLIPVAVRMWQPATVTIRRRPTVSIGK